MGQQQQLSRLRDEMKRRLDAFDIHSLPSEEFRRAVYTIYEIVRDMYAALGEIEREFDDAYEAFSRIVEKVETARARDLLGAVLGDEDKKDKKEEKMPGHYL